MNLVKMKLVKLPVTQYAFGNRNQPRSPRANDIQVENNNVKPTKPLTGDSTFADIKFVPLSVGLTHSILLKLSGREFEGFALNWGCAPNPL